eukprot:scaffold17084_cov130-Isochrysis_galbana.AAC.7
MACAGTQPVWGGDVRWGAAGLPPRCQRSGTTSGMGADASGGAAVSDTAWGGAGDGGGGGGGGLRIAMAAATRASKASMEMACSTCAVSRTSSPESHKDERGSHRHKGCGCRGGCSPEDLGGPAELGLVAIGEAHGRAAADAPRAAPIPVIQPSHCIHMPAARVRASSSFPLKAEAYC